MATPTDEQSKYDALYDWAGIQIFNLVRDRFDPHMAILLDVGAGWGKYAKLLPDYVMDAVEIWQPYVEKELLWKHYRAVFNRDICDFDFDWYDAIIMGDVLEHIDVSRAQELIKSLLDRCDELYVIVPYEYPQGEVEGNRHEAHLQDDLTPKIMRQRYPELDLIAENGQKGIYIKA